MTDLITLRQDARTELGNAYLLNDFDEADRLAERGDTRELALLLDDLAADLRREGLDDLADRLEGFEDQFIFG